MARIGALHIASTRGDPHQFPEGAHHHRRCSPTCVLGKMRASWAESFARADDETSGSSFSRVEQAECGNVTRWPVGSLVGAKCTQTLRRLKYRNLLVWQGTAPLKAVSQRRSPARGGSGAPLVPLGGTTDGEGTHRDLEYLWCHDSSSTVFLWLDKKSISLASKPRLAGHRPSPSRMLDHPGVARA